MIDRDKKAPFNVLFLGRANAARSVMAEAILNREGMGRFRAFSAGRQPCGELHPCAVDLLAKMSFEVDALHPKTWLEFVGPDAMRLDFVFSVCDSATDDTRLPWPGNPMSGHWGLPDPAAVRGKVPEVRLAFADAFRMLSNRVAIFASLPIRSLDALSLKQQIDLIARREMVAPKSAAAA